MKYGLVGGKLGHSFSPDIHKMLDSADYVLKELSADALESFLKSRAFSGINVTIPYKQNVIPYLDHISDNAREIGAVNTIVNKDGKLYGDNTDYQGLKQLIIKTAGDVSGKKVLILGTGGTSKTAYRAVKDLNAADIIKVSRTGGDNAVTYRQAYDSHSDAEIIINTTPVGMYPNTEDCPIDIDMFPNLQGVVDVVFNPLSTQLVLNARKKCVSAMGGLYMLVTQAVEASKLFTGSDYPEDTADRIYNTLIKSKQNIVLSGMPASGKSTVGRIIAEKLNRPFYDVDNEIVKNTKTEITEIFKTKGETYFRDMESEVTKTLSDMSGAVIACGGGTVLRDINVNRLNRNGVIFFIDRPLQQLIPTSDRPLSSNVEDIKRRYSERIDRYISTCNVRIDGGKTAEEVANEIIKEFSK